MGIELPSIVDQEELDERDRKKREKASCLDESSPSRNRLALRKDADFDKLDPSIVSASSGYRFSELKKIIGSSS